MCVTCNIKEICVTKYWGALHPLPKYWVAPIHPSYPPSLFSGLHFLGEAHKPYLANTLWSLLPDQDFLEIPREIHYVIDGALIQHIPWTKGATFKKIIVHTLTVSLIMAVQ